MIHTFHDAKIHPIIQTKNTNTCKNPFFNISVYYFLTFGTYK